LRNSWDFAFLSFRKLLAQNPLRQSKAMALLREVLARVAPPFGLAPQKLAIRIAANTPTAPKTHIDHLLLLVYSRHTCFLFGVPDLAKK
jgi:hypothetical protein